ncbi:hypothetical protein YERSI8AC_240121 [Enterobacterales bacterium 8AC]|nr:hypothetical protein YERSI8AC_240121 [Enterobacterales bacterium 8AC]
MHANRLPYPPLRGRGGRNINESAPFTGETTYVGAAIKKFFIAVFYLLRGGKSPTQTFSFSVRIRRELVIPDKIRVVSRQSTLIQLENRGSAKGDSLLEWSWSGLITSF